MINYWNNDLTKQQRKEAIIFFVIITSILFDCFTGFHVLKAIGFCILLLVVGFLKLLPLLIAFTGLDAPVKKPRRR